MKAEILNIMGETAGNDITITWSLTLDGVAFPSDSTFLFIAEFEKDKNIEISVSGSISGEEVTVTIPKSDTLVSGIYKYQLQETTVAPVKLRTPARGKFELVDVPVVG